MRCPYCQEPEDRVVDSRTSREGRAVRRRRECLSCERRFTTYEYVEERPVRIRKSDGSLESYDRAKLVRSLRLPCAKRDIEPARIEAMVDEIEDAIHGGEAEVESRRVGEMVMSRLRACDHVAYVRFASVYRDFQDIQEFADELRALRRRGERAARNENQAELSL